MNYFGKHEARYSIHLDLFAHKFTVSPVFNYCLPAAWYKGTSLRDKLLVFVCRDFVFVLVLVVYLYEINYPDLSDCLYLL